MIEFRCRRYKRDGTPVVSDLEIQAYAERVLADYKPKLLKEPAKINESHFLESYLGVTVEYQDLYYKSTEEPIAGGTVFNDCNVLIFDRENACIRPIRVKAGTILIDNATMTFGKGGFALFTHLHEGGHFLMHPTVYRRNQDQLTLYEHEETVVCRRSSIGRHYRLVTDEDFREHQASTFAAAIAMPRPTFVPLAQSLLRSAGYKDGIWKENFLLDESDTALPEIIEQLSATFGVSRTAVRVQMHRQGLLLRLEEIPNFAANF